MTAVTANTATVTAGNRWSPNRGRATACAITPTVPPQVWPGPTMATWAGSGTTESAEYDVL
jgi:hypothetical protein